MTENTSPAPSDSPWRGRTVTRGFITLRDGRICAARRIDYPHAGPHHPAAEFTVTIPMRGILQDRKATPGQAATFTTTYPRTDPEA
jgi:hypothetical protein